MARVRGTSPVRVTANGKAIDPARRPVPLCEQVQTLRRRSAIASNVIRIFVHVRPLARLVVWAAPHIADAVARRIPGSGIAAAALAWAVGHTPARFFFSARA
jgi:hypothetical protein